MRRPGPLVLLSIASLAALVPPERPDRQLLAKPAAGPPTPSIVLIVGDDVPLALLGPYGAPSFLTPNLNALASAPGASAMTAAFTPASICTPSRVALLTGRYPSKLAKKEHTEKEHAEKGPIEVGFNCCDPPIQDTSATLHRVLRSAGYYTAFMGKFHMASPPFQALPEPNRRSPLLRACAQLDVSDFQVNDTCASAAVASAVGADEAAAIWWDNVNSLKSRPFHDPERLAELGREFVARSRGAGKRFFLHTNPTLTHEPLGPEMMAAMREKQGDMLSKVEAGLATFIPRSAAQIAAWPDHFALGGRFAITDQQLGRITGANNEAGAVAWLDASLQPLLEEIGDDPDVLTVFTSDHGNVATGKGTPYDGGARVPLLLRWPRHAVAAANVWMRHIDWLPTLAELAGQDPSGLAADGVSRAHALWPTAVDPPATGDDDAQLRLFLENGKSRGVRTTHWKLMVAPELGDDCDALASYTFGSADAVRDVHPAFCSAVQLYDLRSDPQEQNNLANNASYVSTLKWLGAHIKAHEGKMVSAR